MSCHIVGAHQHQRKKRLKRKKLSAMSFGEWVARKFLFLADRWHEETGHLSSPLKIVSHPAYQRIIGMGEKALPFILKDLQQRGGQWYWALRSISGESVPLSSANPTLREVKDAWLRWGNRLRLSPGGKP